MCCQVVGGRQWPDQLLSAFCPDQVRACRREIGFQMAKAGLSLYVLKRNTAMMGLQRQDPRKT